MQDICTPNFGHQSTQGSTMYLSHIGGLPCQPRFSHAEHPQPSQFVYQPTWPENQSFTPSTPQSGLTSHPICDAGALVIIDDLNTPSATSVNTSKALGSDSVCIPTASQLKDSSHVWSARSRSHFNYTTATVTKHMMHRRVYH